MKESGFCTECRFKIPSFDGLDKCPNCGTKGIPCKDTEQVTISINWHELHILFVWAENWGRKINKAGLIYGISHDIEKQFPEKHQLTMMGEVNQLKKDFPDMTITDEKGNEIK